MRLARTTEDEARAPSLAACPCAIRWAPVALAVLLVASPPAQAQDDPVARLRTRVAARPDDASLRCQLAYALVGTGGFDEAYTLASDAIAAIARPPSRRARRTLAACHYNRGLAAEGLGRARDAVADHVASLSFRDNDTVRARLDALVPDVPADLPAAALITYEADHPSLVADQTPPSISLPGGTSLHFVTARASAPSYETILLVYALRVGADGTVEIVELDRWAQEDSSAPIEVESVSRFSAPGLEGATVAIDATGGGACRRMEGFMDFGHEATALVAVVGDSIRSSTFVTSQSDCGERISTAMRVAGPDVVVTRSRGDALAPGTYPITSFFFP